MSTNANISKTLVIESPQKLYQILDYHKDLVKDSIELKIFMDQMNLTVEGCDCDTFEFVGGAIDIYVDLRKMSDQSISLFKSTIGCDKILFRMKDKNLFEI